VYVLIEFRISGSICKDAPIALDLTHLVGENLLTSARQPVIIVRGPDAHVALEVNNGLEVKSNGVELWRNVRLSAGVRIPTDELLAAEGYADISWEAYEDDIFALNLNGKLGFGVKVNVPSGQYTPAQRAATAVLVAGVIIFTPVDEYVAYGLAADQTVVMIKAVGEYLKNYRPLQQSSAVAFAQIAAQESLRGDSRGEMVQLMQQDSRSVLETYFGNGFAKAAVISPLQLDRTNVRQGEQVKYTGSGFVPNGRVLLTVTTGTTSEVFDIVADGEGKISGALIVPNARGGTQLVTAIDLDGLFYQLEEYYAGRDLTVSPYVQSALITLPHTVNMPLIVR
jgi:hypothetical protein